MRIKWTEVKLGELQRRLNRGMTINQLADMYGITKQSLCTTMRKNGIVSQNQQRRDRDAEKIKNASEIDIAFFAGLFEGEGCFGKSSIQIQMHIKNEDVLKKIQHLVGGTIYYPTERAKKDDYCQWAMMAHREMLISRAYPYFSSHRREQIKKYLTNLNLSVV